MRIDSIERELAQVEEDVSEAESEYERSVGRMDSMLDRLKEEHKLESVKDIEPELNKLNKELSSVSEEIQHDYKELKETYDW